jgi:hypothetical protein
MVGWLNAAHDQEGGVYFRSNHLAVGVGGNGLLADVVASGRGISALLKVAYA